MIVYTCPECGYDLRESVVCTMPPVYVADCPNCGWHHERRGSDMRVPYPYAITGETSCVLQYPYGEN